MKKIAILNLLLLVLFTANAQVDWQTTIDKKSKISFKLPGKPNIQNKTLNGITTQIFSYRDAATVFGVVASDFSAKKLNFNHSDYSELYEQMKKSSIKADAKFITENSIPYQQLLGKEIIYTEIIRKKEYTYYKRFFFHNNFIYQIVVGGPSRFKKLLLDKKQLFFNSVTFLK